MQWQSECEPTMMNLLKVTSQRLMRRQRNSLQTVMVLILFLYTDSNGANPGDNNYLQGITITVEIENRI